MKSALHQGPFPTVSDAIKSLEECLATMQRTSSIRDSHEVRCGLRCESRESECRIDAGMRHAASLRGGTEIDEHTFGIVLGIA
jgi:hypothetical protein